ncbi:methionine aminopeptidase 1A-like [Zingiber officinale]|uniref:methionine aminopeptidase 1A-like n=1 Tax=Zingiber officinale TaxID=94328 RepID=UPI001C4C8C82|nr:methionine aminopeptidase 1A-like [Zingiber officinale]
MAAIRLSGMEISDLTLELSDLRRLEDGDIVNVDVTVYYKGIHGDLSETFFVGEVDEASRHLVHCTYECLEKAIFIVKPGIRFRDVEVFNRHATMSGLAVRDRLWPDGWTAVTGDGKRSVQLEHTLLASSTFILLSVLNANHKFSVGVNCLCF